MKRNRISSLLTAAALLCALLLTVLPCLASEPVLVVAGSDFQNPLNSYNTYDYAGNGDYTEQVRLLTAIMGNIKAEYGDACGFLAGGDYDFDETKLTPQKTETGIAAVRGAVEDVFGQNVNMVFVQGNHDSKLAEGLAPSGANDTEHYGVFVMNENDYRAYPLNSSKWSDFTKSRSTAEKLAAKLEEYLKEKADSGYDKPVFVLSHVPLHYSTRTLSDNDAIYAEKFYDVLTAYGDRLNIIFLFGHDHAHGDDDYLGGSSVFLTRGDTINISQYGTSKEFAARPLNFTYMNYGYTGYFWSFWAKTSAEVAYSDADGTLTMTAFLIDGADVTVSRWDENGMHALKSEGKASQGLRGIPECCEVNETVVAGPQTVRAPEPAPVELSSADSAPIETVEPEPVEPAPAELTPVEAPPAPEQAVKSSAPVLWIVLAALLLIAAAVCVWILRKKKK